MFFVFYWANNCNLNEGLNLVMKSDKIRFKINIERL